jgi:O-antigen/teichoic acid export membrane protein
MVTLVCQNRPDAMDNTRLPWRDVVVSSSWMLAGTVFIAGTQWLIVSIVAHRGGAVGLGQISLAQAYVTCLSYVGWLALRNHYVVEGDRYPFSDYLFLRIVFPAVLYGGLILVALMGMLGEAGLSVTIVAFSFLKFVEGFSDLNSGVFQRVHRSHTVTLAAGLRFLATALVFPAVYAISGNAESALMSLAVAWLVLYFLFDNRMRRALVPMSEHLISVEPKVTGRRWGLFTVSLPLGVSSAIMILNTYTPRFGIIHLLGPNALGHFTAVQYFANFGGTLVAVVCQASLPTLARCCSQRLTSRFLGLTGGLVLFSLFGCLCGWLLIQVVGRQVLGAVYGSSFEQVQPLFAAAIPTMFFVFCGSIVGAAATAMRIYRTILMAYIGSALVAAGLTWVLLPRLDLLGAFLAVGLAGLFQAAVLAVGIVLSWRTGAAR